MLEQHCLYQVVQDFKLDHQLGKAEEQFKHRIKKSSSAMNEAQNCSSADQVRRTRAVIECEVVQDFKLDHQLGKAEEQFKHRIKKSSSAMNEAQNCSSADQVRRTRAVIECEVNASWNKAL
ncbi:dual specificity protein phosphatase 12-like [Dorcoceras hygrometricum]|uniref:Dual specificity protein phosphatase 12-like n=1 Tax=Dorcoceras hygrometricum TaxID=472368 RepID=A0A2Z7AZ51_9LAMI|nr:dual specificity protein phosphatase 12-like [Dorcoceras hygrometricum]